MAVLRKLLQLILFLAVLQLGRGTTTSQELRRLTPRVLALEEEVEEVKNSTLAIMNILVTIKEDLAVLREDTQDVKRELTTIKGDTQDVKRELATVREDTNSTLMDLATLREDTNSRMQDLQEGLTTLRQEGSQERAEVNATVSKIQETVEEDNLIMNSVRDASQKHQQFTTEQFSNITEEIQDIQQSFLGLASQCDTSSPVTECNPLISVQYLPTSCGELPTSSPSGYYLVRNSDGSAVNVYCYMTSQQDPAPSCQHIAETHPSIPSGYYWVESSNGSAVNMYCTSPQDPAPSCQYIAETHPSAPSGYYWVRSSNGSAVNVYCYVTSQQDPAPSCQHIAETHPSTPSGYYWVESSNGSAVNVYCDNHLTSQEEPSHSCQYIAETHPSTPSGYYWIESSNGSAVNVYCDNHLTSPDNPSPSCRDIVKMHPSTPSGYYWVRSSNGSAVNVYCSSPQVPAPSCQYIAEIHRSAPPGYYWVRSSNGSAVNVYCDMARHCCGNAGGWMRVAYLDMTHTSQQCPGGFRLRSEPKRTCELINYGSCTSILYPSHHIQYSKVCGRVRAYQYGPTVAFARYYSGLGPIIDDNYVSGMSITHGESPRKHIWTFAAALDEIRSDSYVCPCTKTDTTYTGRLPPFIGNDYFCDSGNRGRFQIYRIYSEDPLWDGEGCGPTSSCCQFNSPPWFCKELPQPTTDDVEVRMCRHDSFRGTPFDLIELYVQ